MRVNINLSKVIHYMKRNVKSNLRPLDRKSDVNETEQRRNKIHDVWWWTMS